MLTRITLFFLLCLSCNLCAGEKLDLTESLTIYVWMPDATLPMKGQCFEIDQTTRGERFSSKISSSKCRPKDVSYQWIVDSSQIGGKCYEVDANKGASGFSNKVGDRKCYPENVEFILNSGNCYAKGVLKTGDNFLTKTLIDDCRPAQLKYEYILDTKLNRGLCYSSDLSGVSDFKRRVDITKCRPKLTTFIFDDRKNKCYEVDAASGPEGYLDSVSLSKCLNKTAATYAFISNECYEKSLGPDAEDIILKTKIENCRPAQTNFQFEFKSTFEGDCVEVDSLTLGEAFRSRVSAERCRPDKTAYIYVSEIRRCLEVDEESKGQAFVAGTDPRNCETVKNDGGWVQSETNIYEGNCNIKIRDALGVEKERIVLADRCRPDKTRYDWLQDQEFDGKCYEVHAVKGPALFSKQVADLYCDPKDKKIVYRDIQGSLIGVCLIVDGATSGANFRRKVNSRLCKEKMGLIAPK